MKQKPKEAVELLARTTSKSVLKHTGRNWDDWLVILKKSQAIHMTHKEIVHLLKTKYKLTHWWQQIVASGFEIHSGKKIQGQNEKGEYSVTVTKLLNISQKKFWIFFKSQEGIQIWLEPMSSFTMEKGESFEIAGGVFGEVRTITHPGKVRLHWNDSDWPKKTTVQVHVIPKPKDRCHLVFSHEQLANSRIKEKQRAYWKQKATDLAVAFNEKA